MYRLSVAISLCFPCARTARTARTRMFALSAPFFFLRVLTLVAGSYHMDKFKMTSNNKVVHRRVYSIVVVFH